MSQIWRGMSGGIEVLENVNEMADLPDISTIDSEGVWYIESGEFGPDYIAPTNWDSGAGEFTDWFSLFDGRILADLPDSVVDDFERDNPLNDWGGDTGAFSVVTDGSMEGEQHISTTSSSIADSTVTLSQSPITDGRIPQRGEIFSYLCRTGDAANDDAWFAFFADSGTDNARGVGKNQYSGGISRGDLEIRKDGDIIADTSITADDYNNKIIEFEYEVLSDGTIALTTFEVDLQEDVGSQRTSQIDSISANDSEYDSGDIAFSGGGEGNSEREYDRIWIRETE